VIFLTFFEKVVPAIVKATAAIVCGDEAGEGRDENDGKGSEFNHFVG
jgi:hypothetical protein